MVAQSLIPILTLSLIHYILPALLIFAAIWDVASYTIPNGLQLVLIAAFAAFALAAGLPLGLVGTHLLFGLGALVAGFAFFGFGWIGGGDAKLLAVIALWLGWGTLSFLVAAAVFGGALSLLILIFRGFPLPLWAMRVSWIDRLHKKTSGIPYGVALAAGCLFVLPQTEIFAFVEKTIT